MSQSNVIRILIADDHPILGQALTMFLECEPDITVVGYAGDGRKALELFCKHQPDVAVMDLQMPKMEGGDADGGNAKSCIWAARFTSWVKRRHHRFDPTIYSSLWEDSSPAI